ncbi:hypothetical protein NQZ79_g6518 [Umbelopsis isabellina]|nr:hypothetical protein NQZ79_g6518 [Umbelopsis isabellina]
MPALSKVTITANVFHVMASHAASTEKVSYNLDMLYTMPLLTLIDRVGRDYRSSAWQLAGEEYIQSILPRSSSGRGRGSLYIDSLRQTKRSSRNIATATASSGGRGGENRKRVGQKDLRCRMDVRTQLSQQLMDERFFGLIVSCFDADADHTQRLQITCFQSNDDPERGPVQLKIPLQILPDLSMEKHTTQSIIDISQKIYEEQVKEFLLSSQRVQYQGTSEGSEQNAMIVDTNSSNEVQSLPQKLSELYNAGVYGQAITSLVDKLIIPATELAKQRHAMNLLEIKRLELLRDSRSRDENSL